MKKNINLKEYLNNDNIYFVVAMSSVILYVIWLFLPSIQNMLGARAAIFFMALFFISTIMDKSFLKANIKEYFIKIILLLFVSAFYSAIYTIGIKNLLVFFPQAFMLFFPILISYYIIKSNKTYLLDLIFIITLIACIITSVINLTWLFRYGLTLRYMAHGSTDTEYIKRAMSYGIGGFGFTYGLNMFFALLLFGFSQLKLKISKFIASVVIVLFALSIYKSRYFIALFILFCIVFLFLIDYVSKIICRITKIKHNLWYTFAFGIFITIILFIFRDSLITNLAAYLHDYGLVDYSNKLLKIRDLLVNFNVETDNSSRLEYYISGIDTIINSPWIGIKLDPYTYDISRHSTMIDTFAGFGVPAGVFTLACFIYSLKGIYSNIFKSENKQIMIFMLIIFFILFASNTIVYCREAFFTCFFLTIYLDSNVNNNIFKVNDGK